MFIYDTHVHSNECSQCAHSSAREMVHTYKEAGFAGFVLTNHFFRGNTCVSRELEWRDFVRHYYEAYLEAYDEGQKLDIDVFLGYEEFVGDGKELLIYNIDFETMSNMPEIRGADRQTIIDAVHSAGGFIVHAHPYRNRSYMGGFTEPDFSGCDGIEVYNHANHSEENKLAFDAARKLGLVMTAGMDNHHAGLRPDSGVIFDHRVKTSEEFVKALKSPSTRLMRKWSYK